MALGLLSVTVPLFGGLPFDRGTFASASSRMARAPAWGGAVEGGLFTVCPGLALPGCGCAPVWKLRVRGESVGTLSDPS